MRRIRVVPTKEEQKILVRELTKLPLCYMFRCSEEQLEQYGIHLLALSHVYSVPHLKQIVTKDLAKRLNVGNVVDLLQLARLCDAPDLYLKCMKLVQNKFKSVEETEAWQFLQDHDPHLELQILEFIDEAELVYTYTINHKYFVAMLVL